MKIKKSHKFDKNVKSDLNIVKKKKQNIKQIFELIVD